jgi:hypothetical protein
VGFVAGLDVDAVRFGVSIFLRLEARGESSMLEVDAVRGLVIGACYCVFIVVVVVVTLGEWRKCVWRRVLESTSRVALVLYPLYRTCITPTDLPPQHHIYNSKHLEQNQRETNDALSTLLQQRQQRSTYKKPRTSLATAIKASLICLLHALANHLERSILICCLSELLYYDEIGTCAMVRISSHTRVAPPLLWFSNDATNLRPELCGPQLLCCILLHTLASTVTNNAIEKVRLVLLVSPLGSTIGVSLLWCLCTSLTPLYVSALLVTPSQGAHHAH